MALQPRSKIFKYFCAKIIKNWIEINHKYNHQTWNFETTSKRIISWLSNSKLSYDEANEQYKIDFNHIIQKQTSYHTQINKIKIIMND